MADASQRNGDIREHVLLFSRFLRSPRTVGAFWPSSSALAKAMVARPSGLNTSETIVELGPGTGAFTGAIVERLGPSARFLAVDIEPAFVESIRRRWPEVECVCASAEHLEQLSPMRDIGPVDHIVSGLPFASLPVDMTQPDPRRHRHGRFASAAPSRRFSICTATRCGRGASSGSSMSARMGAPPERRSVAQELSRRLVLTWTRRYELIGSRRGAVGRHRFRRRWLRQQTGQRAAAGVPRTDRPE